MASIKLYDGQLAELRKLHPRAGASEVVRLLIDKYIFETNKKIEDKLKRTESEHV